MSPRDRTRKNTNKQPPDRTIEEENLLGNLGNVTRSNNNRFQNQSSNTTRNQANTGFHALPFKNAFFEYLRNNQGKEHSLVLGVGTSGSSDVKHCARYALSVAELNQRKGFFLLMIDTEYESESNRRISLEPLELLGFELLDSHSRAIHRESGISVYLWGVTLPTAYEPMEKYNELRDDPEGPYNYGKQCLLTHSTEEIYNRLASFLRVPLIRTIYVYNNGIWDDRNPQIIASRNSFYRGPLFRDQSRLIHQSFEELMTRSRRNYSPMISRGVYFENFCELLFILWNSQKPVYLLKKEDGMLVHSNLYRSEGGHPANNIIDPFASNSLTGHSRSRSRNNMNNSNNYLYRGGKSRRRHRYSRRRQTL